MFVWNLLLYVRRRICEYLLSFIRYGGSVRYISIPYWFYILYTSYWHHVYVIMTSFHYESLVMSHSDRNLFCFNLWCHEPDFLVFLTTMSHWMSHMERSRTSGFLYIRRTDFRLGLSWISLSIRRRLPCMVYFQIQRVEQCLFAPIQPPLWIHYLPDARSAWAFEFSQSPHPVLTFFSLSNLLS